MSSAARSSEDLREIYSKVKEWVETYYGKKGWFYTDYFIDEDGFEYFKEQLESDPSVTEDMSNDDVADVIEEQLGKNITMSIYQQEYLAAVLH